MSGEQAQKIQELDETIRGWKVETRIPIYRGSNVLDGQLIFPVGSLLHSLPRVTDTTLLVRTNQGFGTLSTPNPFRSQ